MITPVSILTINQICDRQNDLLVSADDIKKIADNAKNKVAEKTAEIIIAKFEVSPLGINFSYKSSEIKLVIEAIIEEIKDGKINVY